MPTVTARFDRNPLNLSRPAVCHLVVEVTAPRLEQETPQSVVLFGMRGVKRNDPDYFAAYVMNYILGGGGLTSRLETVGPVTGKMLDASSSSLGISTMARSR